MDPVLDRFDAAERVKASEDVNISLPFGWNTQPCAKHSVPGRWQTEEHGDPRIVGCQIDCYECGIPSWRKHQRKGIAWLYLRGSGALFDPVGTGKTIHGAGLIGVKRERGDLARGRVVVVMKPQALTQWYVQLNRCLPDVNTIMQEGGKPTERARKYGQPWEVCCVSYMTLLRDVDILTRFPLELVIFDDVDPLRDSTNAVSKAAWKMQREANNTVVMTGTPLQKQLVEEYEVLALVGARSLYQSKTAFEKSHVKKERQIFYVKDRFGGHKKMSKMVTTGVRNTEHWKQISAPFYMRRRTADIDDVSMPSIQPNTVWLDIYPSQRMLYDRLQGIVRDDIAQAQRHQAQPDRISAMGRIQTGALILAGLAAMGQRDDAETSVKFDWIEQAFTDELFAEDEKVVVFLGRLQSLAALGQRMDRLGIGWVGYSRLDNNRQNRANALERFRHDPTCRVLLGTQSIEQSLDLQVARHLVCVDTILNPARMEQLAGRIRRDGSRYRTVYVHNLWCRDSQEDGYKQVLEEEQALIDHIWDEQSELFEALPPLRLLQLITG